MFDDISVAVGIVVVQQEFPKQTCVQLLLGKCVMRSVVAVHCVSVGCLWAIDTGDATHTGGVEMTISQCAECVYVSCIRTYMLYTYVVS